MDAEKFAQKTILVQDSDDGSNDAHSPQLDETGNEQPLDGAVLPTDSPSNYSKASVETGLDRFPDVKLPDIKIPEPQKSDQTNSKVSIEKLGLHFKSSRHVFTTILFLLVLGALAFGANLLSERSRTETAYRNYVDQAQLAEIGDDTKKAAVNWRAAIEQATKLGGSHKELGDMYARLAKDEITLAPGFTIDFSSNPEGVQLLKQDLHRAIEQYRMMPNSTLPQIEAQFQLLEAMPVRVMNSDFGDFDLVKIKAARRKASSLRKQGKVAEAAKEYVECIRHGHLRNMRGDRDEVLWREVETFVTDMKPGDPNANNALALAYAVVFFTDSQNTNESFKSMREADALLVKALEKTGNFLRNYESAKLLADQMFDKGDYYAASVGYWRCQGMRDSAAVRERLRQCFLKIHPVSSTAIEEILPVLDELKRLHTSAFGADSRQVTSILEYYANAYLKTGDFENAEKTRHQILSRKLADTSSELDYEPHHGYASYNVVSKAYESLLEVYILEGKLTEARAIYQGIPKTVMSEIRDSALDNHYIDACSRAGWLNDAKVSKSPEPKR